ncbi:hypothetical protein [Acetobacter lambici]|uniref:Uncharacterized protein n=1 Tax=Acetobacter lambici TaxID=1332824 RepID=A0ABT1F447_9PROT|nr:hypothetical protein [Acetobacter lambici]MCP1242873.1 hypothetical protein [Acetobacter lambici]MCP1259044.1 hypothetical protein [Acetobacter lambici]
MSRKERALAELEEVYAKIRSDIDNAGPDANFSYVGSLTISEQSGKSVENKIAVFGCIKFILPCVASAFTEAMRSYQAGRTPQQIANVVNHYMNAEQDPQQKPWEQTPCSTMQH